MLKEMSKDSGSIGFLIILVDWLFDSICAVMFVSQGLKLQF